ncbi:MAG: hypothetical protein AAF846_27415 [Chloroflexota bacterium]
MEYLLLIAIIASGGLHGFTFVSILVRIFSLDVRNRFFPSRDPENLSKFFRNNILISFIVLANVAWNDNFSGALVIYSGSGLLAVVFTVILAVMGKIIGTSTDDS